MKVRIPHGLVSGVDVRRDPEEQNLNQRQNEFGVNYVPRPRTLRRESVHATCACGPQQILVRVACVGFKTSDLQWKLL